MTYPFQSSALKHDHHNHVELHLNRIADLRFGGGWYILFQQVIPWNVNHRRLTTPLTGHPAKRPSAARYGFPARTFPMAIANSSVSTRVSSMCGRKGGSRVRR